LARLQHKHDFAVATPDPGLAGLDYLVLLRTNRDDLAWLAECQPLSIATLSPFSRTSRVVQMIVGLGATAARIPLRAASICSTYG